MARRGRMIGVALGLFLLFLFITSRHSGSHPRDLRSKAKDITNDDELRPVIKEPPGRWDALDDKFREQHISGGGGQGNLKDQSEEVRKPNIEADEIKRKSPKKGKEDTEKVADIAKPVDGADKIKGQPDTPKRPKKQGGGSGAVVTDDDGKDEKKDGLEVKEYDPAEDLKVILTQAPIIIISKSYCPHSRDAKRILLDNHKIEPAPFVVELDKHPNGPTLQAYLGEITGRRTVPNVIVNGVSIGGGDEMRALEAAGTVAETFLGRLPGKISVDGRATV